MPYNRNDVIKYAKKWAFYRNPKYYNFDNIGGDCTNFCSQCLFAGCKTMNYTPIFGWYYTNLNNRTASWTGVEYLYNFLINNKGIGPQGTICNEKDIKIGDIIQLGNSQYKFYHSLIVVKKTSNEIFIATHTFDAYMRKLSSYSYNTIRYIHIND